MKLSPLGSPWSILGYLPVFFLVTASITYNGNDVLQFYAGQNMTRTCWSLYQSIWVLPENEQYREVDEQDPLSDGRASINETRTKTGWFKLKLTIHNLRQSDTGFYTCKATGSFFDEVTITSGPQYSRVYVLVSSSDEEKIFLHRRDDKQNSFGRLVPAWKNRDTYVPCLVTRLDVDLKLVIDGVEGKEYAYDPRYGFLLPHKSLDFGEPRSGRCLARVKGNSTTSDKIQILLLPIEHTDLLKPKIILGSDRYPYKKGRLKLYCVNPGNVSDPAITFINCSWNNIPDQSGVQLKATSTINKTLLIEDLQIHHSGNYTCTCQHLLDEDSETAATHYVDVSTTKGRIFYLSPATSSTAIRSIGESVRFATRSMAWPEDEIKVEWFHRFRNAFYQTEMRELTDSRQSNILTLENLEVNDTGIYVYRITAGGDLQRELLFSLVVKGEAIVTGLFITDVNNIDQIVDSRYLELENAYDLYCIGEGFPLPNMQILWSPCARPSTDNDQCSWTEMTENSERMVVNEGDFQRSILVQTIAKKSGRYACEVTDLDAGEVNNSDSSATIKYIVSDIRDSQLHKSLSVSLITADSSMEIYDTDTVIAKCHYQPLVYTSAHWVNVSSNTTVETWFPGLFLRRLIGRLTSTATLKFPAIQRDHRGAYACVAKIAPDMGGGYARREFQIVINETVPLHFGNLSSLKQLNAAAGYGSVEIYCDAYGAPSPMITWLKEGKMIQWKEREPKLRLSNGNRTLTIRHPTVTDEGLYTCRLTNRFQSVGTNFVLRISSNSSNALPYWTYALAVLSALLALVIMGLLVWLLLARRRKKLAMAAQMSQLRELYADLITSVDESAELNPDQPVNEQADQLRYDRKYEMDLERISLGRLLGEGQFGKVYEGTLEGNEGDTEPKTVAVKVPKVGTSPSQQKALLTEFKIMSYIGDHINVLRLIGAVTRHIVTGRLYVVVEHCKLGSLSDYLKKHRDHFVDELVRSSENDYEAFADSDGYVLPNYRTPAYVEKPDEGWCQRYRAEMESNWSKMHAEHRLVEDHLCTSDLLWFAFQVANGMDYLASKKIIHRDVAVRNVLLHEHKIIKICDFGLARRDYMYHTEAVGVPLPVKWMAIESILYQEYTAKSDIWSYGVVTWEIFSLAETPYPAQAVDRNFITWLKNEENRLQCPEFAPEPVYTLMRKCWLSIPDDRPAFRECRSYIGEELFKCNRYYYNELMSILRIPEDSSDTESTSDTSSSCPRDGSHSNNPAILLFSADSEEQDTTAVNDAYFHDMRTSGCSRDVMEMQPLKKEEEEDDGEHETKL